MAVHEIESTPGGVTLTGGSVGLPASGLAGNHLTLEMGNDLALKLGNHLTPKVGNDLTPELGNHLALAASKLGNHAGPRHSCNGLPQIIRIHTDNSNRTWERWVSDNINMGGSRHTLEESGEHVLKFWVVDTGVVLQRLVVDPAMSSQVTWSRRRVFMELESRRPVVRESFHRQQTHE